MHQWLDEKAPPAQVAEGDTTTWGTSGGTRDIQWFGTRNAHTLWGLGKTKQLAKEMKTLVISEIPTVVFYLAQTISTRRTSI